jgi:hypothetical protein
MAEGFWVTIPEHFPHVELDVFVVMPNHVHGILVFSDAGDSGQPSKRTRHCVMRRKVRPRRIRHEDSAFSNPSPNPSPRCKEGLLFLPSDAAGRGSRTLRPKSASFADPVRVASAG